MPVGISTLIGKIQVEWGPMAAGGIIGALPILIFAFIVQRHFVRGMTLGACEVTSGQEKGLAPCRSGSHGRLRASDPVAGVGLVRRARDQPGRVRHRRLLAGAHAGLAELSASAAARDTLTGELAGHGVTLGALNVSGEPAAPRTRR